MNEVVGDVVELMQTRAADAGVELHWHPAARYPAADVRSRCHPPRRPERGHQRHRRLREDRRAVEVVFAREYDMPQRHRVGCWCEDNGEGIPPEDITKIFSVFESRKGSRGTGLGLPVSQKIMLEHDGDISVESEPDAGSCFCLWMPAVLAEDPGTTQPGAPRGAHQSP